MPTRVTTGTPFWSFSCSDQASDLNVSVGFPVQTEGPITVMPGEGGLEFEVTTFNIGTAIMLGSMTQSAANLTSSKLDAKLDASMRASGTLDASWAKPAAGCTTGSPPGPCGEGSVRVTFNVQLR